VAVGSVKNFARLAKIRIGWGSEAKATAVDIARRVSDQPGATFAQNSGRPASTRIGSENKVKAIVAAIVRPVDRDEVD